MTDAPSRARLVDALSSARREVAAHQAQNRLLEGWLDAEVRLRGIRENAAVLAVMESPERRVEIAEAYRREHPDRAAVLDELLTCLE